MNDNRQRDERQGGQQHGLKKDHGGTTSVKLVVLVEECRPAFTFWVARPEVLRRAWAPVDIVITFLGVLQFQRGSPRPSEYLRACHPREVHHALVNSREVRHALRSTSGR